MYLSFFQKRCRIAIRIAVTLVMVVLVATSVEPTAADDTFESPADSLTARIGDLRANGEYGTALDAARELATLVASNPDATEWQRADTDTLVATLERVTRWPEDRRRELQRADSLAVVRQSRFETHDYPTSIAAGEEEVALRSRLLGPMHPETGQTAVELSGPLLVQGEFARADSLLDLSLTVGQSLLGGEHPLVPYALYQRSTLRMSEGHLPEALEAATDGLERSRRIGDEDRVRHCLFVIAYLLSAQGRSAEAENRFRELIALSDGTGELYTGSLAGLATLYMRAGDYVRAEPLFRQAIARTQIELGPDDINVAVYANNLAVLLRRQGDFAESEALYRQALQAFRENLGDDSPRVTDAMSNLALVLGASGDHVAAEAMARDALARRRAQYGDDHPQTAKTMGVLGIQLRDLGRYAEAVDLYEEAVDIRRRRFGMSHPDVAMSLHGLGAALWELERYDEAEVAASEAAAIRHEFYGDRHPLIANSLALLTRCHTAQGDLAGADTLLTEWVRVFEDARVRAGVGVHRATFQRSPYEKLAVVRLEEGDLEGAWEAAEQSRGRVLFELLLASENRSLDPGEAAVGDSLSREIKRLERRIKSLRKRARGEALADGLEESESARAATEALIELRDLESKLSAFEEELARKYPVTEGQAYPLKRVQAALPPDEAIMGWVSSRLSPTERRVWGYVIRSDGPVRWERLPGAEQDTTGGGAGTAVTFRRSLTEAARSAFGATLTNATSEDARRLYSDWIAPLSGALGDVTQLIVIPSGAMIGTPVEPLLDERDDYLGDRFLVSYAPSATITAWLRERTESDDADIDPALLVGDPPFSTAQLEEMVAQDVAVPTSETLVRGAMAQAVPVHRLADEPDGELPRLVWSRREVGAIGRVLDDPVVLVGPDASEERMSDIVRSGSLEDFRVLHFATHALVDDRRPELSALVLAQTGLPDPVDVALRGGEGYDGLVTAQEIVRDWNLSADLVTLSACETGLGRSVSGEGYVGFAHAFLQAGARSLLLSLWSVDDEATARLMERFYETLADPDQGESGDRGRSHRVALAEAKRWLRTYTAPDGTRPFAHPCYWSSFVLMGAD